MKINEYISNIKKFNACGEAIKDALNYKTSQELWDDYERGDWMLWLIGKTRSDTEDGLRKLTGVKVKCARLVQHLMKDKRSLAALDIAERFSKGEATRKELDDAAISPDGKNAGQPNKNFKGMTITDFNKQYDIATEAGAAAYDKWEADNK